MAVKFFLVKTPNADDLSALPSLDVTQAEFHHSMIILCYS